LNPPLDRCLRLHGVGNLDALKPVTPREVRKSFKSNEPGHLYMDVVGVKYLPQMADETQRRYGFRPLIAPQAGSLWDQEKHGSSLCEVFPPCTRRIR